MGYMDRFSSYELPEEPDNLSVVAQFLAELPPNPLPEDSTPGREWVVIGGKDSGGIVVRNGKQLSSMTLDGRLQNTAIIEEVEKNGDRLHYKKIFGAGPDQGWVS